METDTAYLDIHIATDKIVITDFFDEGVHEDGNDFQHDIEQRIAALIARELNMPASKVMVESDWYEQEHACQKEIADYPVGTSICGEPTALRKGTPAGTYRRCGYGHEHRA